MVGRSDVQALKSFKVELFVCCGGPAPPEITPVNTSLTVSALLLPKVMVRGAVPRFTVAPHVDVPVPV